MHMNKCYAVSIYGALLVCLCFGSFGQTNQDRIPFREKTIQFSSFPGISTAGLESGKYTYKYSFNLFSGIAAGTKYFSYATISNLGTRSSTGIQLAGFANIIGTQSYLHLTNFEQKQLEKEGKTPNQHGIQLSGLMNFVRGESAGVQITGGFNNVYRNSSGFHLAGFSNSAGGNMIGVQMAGFYNYTKSLIYGGQLGAINMGAGTLTGFQLGLINRVKVLDGRANSVSTATFGLQLGLINYSKANNGIQIGLINRAKKMTGIQIGLINIFTKSPYPGGNEFNGIPIGLLNIGSRDSRLRVSRSDILPFIVEYTTGNCHNCTFTQSRMPFDDKFYKTNQNALIFAYDYWDESEIAWAAGYGFHRVYYNKSSAGANDFNNKRIYLSPAIRFVHLNRSKKFDPALSLMTQLRFEAGIRVKRFTYFLGANCNAYFYRTGEPLDISRELVRGSSEVNYQIWPGFVYGIKIQGSSPLRDNFREAIKFLFR